MSRLGTGDCRNDGIVEVTVQKRWTVMVNVKVDDPDALKEGELWELVAGILCNRYTDLMNEVAGSTAAHAPVGAWVWDETAQGYVGKYQVVFTR